MKEDLKGGRGTLITVRVDKLDRGGYTLAKKINLKLHHLCCRVLLASVTDAMLPHAFSGFWKRC